MPRRYRRPGIRRGRRGPPPSVFGCRSELFYDKPLHLVRGEGVWLYDAMGRAYLDVYNMCRTSVIATRRGARHSEEAPPSWQRIPDTSRETFWSTRKR